MVHNGSGKVLGFASVVSTRVRVQVPSFLVQLFKPTALCDKDWRAAHNAWVALYTWCTLIALGCFAADVDFVTELLGVPAFFCVFAGGCAIGLGYCSFLSLRREEHCIPFAVHLFLHHRWVAYAYAFFFSCVACVCLLLGLLELAGSVLPPQLASVAGIYLGIAHLLLSACAFVLSVGLARIGNRAEGLGEKELIVKITERSVTRGGVLTSFGREEVVSSA